MSEITSEERRSRIGAKTVGPNITGGAKVNSFNILDPNGIAEILGFARAKGVSFWLANGKLHYRAPKDALTHSEMERLRRSKAQIVALLETSTASQAAEPLLVPRQRLDHVPLAFSQAAHWNLYRLNQRRCIRQIAGATRLCGCLNIKALRESIAEIVRRHEALRTRIVFSKDDGTLVQEIDERGRSELVVIDLRTVPNELREAAVTDSIEQLILEPIDPALGPLFGTRLLQLNELEHVLIVAMEHMISDAYSLNILWEEIFSAYRQISQGRVVYLPPVPIQFADYAVWQREAHTSWIYKHSAYWAERLVGIQRLHFPTGKCFQTSTRPGWGCVPLPISRDLKERLAKWARVRQTTLVMSIFTAYVGLVLHWCNVSDVLVQYQIDGRACQKLRRTIGYVASVLYLRISIVETDNFVDLLNRVTKEYCQAYEHSDSSYMESQIPRPAFTLNPFFNWVPDADQTDIVDAGEAITTSTVRFEHPIGRNLDRDNEPMVELRDTEGEVLGGVYFALSRYSTDAMEVFGRNFFHFIGALLDRPEQRLRDIPLLQ